MSRIYAIRRHWWQRRRALLCCVRWCFAQADSRYTVDYMEIKWPFCSRVHREDWLRWPYEETVSEAEDCQVCDL